MTHDSFAALLALVGIVIIVSSLLSGAVERTGLPQVAIFLLVGAALASTDPVLLRTLVRHPSLPPSAKLALRLESGMNDVILLPIVVLCMLTLRAGVAAPAWEIGSRAVGLFLLGPMLGVFAGWVALT